MTEVPHAVKQQRLFDIEEQFTEKERMGQHARLELLIGPRQQGGAAFVRGDVLRVAGVDEHGRGIASVPVLQRPGGLKRLRVDGTAALGQVVHRQLPAAQLVSQQERDYLR